MKGMPENNTQAEAPALPPCENYKAKMYSLFAGRSGTNK